MLVILLSLFAGRIAATTDIVVHYYLDPGTGSYLVQVLIASLVGAAYVTKVHWNRIKDFFQRTVSRPGRDESLE